VAEVLVLVWGLVIAIARLAPGAAGKPIRVIATLYADVFRGLPAIINIYLIGFGVPLTGLPILKDFSQDTFCILALTLTYGAYVAEVYRAGIESIHWSQTAAARSLGLSYLQTLRFVIVPQAVRRIIPPLLNDFIGLQKDTALVNVIGTIDAFNQAKIVASNHFNLSSVTTWPCSSSSSPSPRHGWWTAWWSATSAACGPAAARSRVGHGPDRDPRHPQALRRARGVQGPVAGGRGASGGLPDRPLGLREIDPAALHQRAGDHRAGRDPHPWRPHDGARASTSMRCGATSASSSRASTSFPI
jgi:amine acid ABC transporter, permease protein, 3-TM region, His/Glu/Gln/Arg/opine family